MAQLLRNSGKKEARDQGLKQILSKIVALNVALCTLLLGCLQ